MANFFTFGGNIIINMSPEDILTVFFTEDSEEVVVAPGTRFSNAKSTTIPIYRVEVGTVYGDYDVELGSKEEAVEFVRAVADYISGSSCKDSNKSTVIDTSTASSKVTPKTGKKAVKK